MPIVSEKATSRQAIKSSITSQFWEQAVHSTKSVDGQLWSLPCEPPTLNLTGSSGLSRTQQLLAAQAVRVPFFPSYDGSSNGLVLDRVLAKAGGRRWWAALSGRVKAQRAYNLGASGRVRKVDAARDLSNYALCARSRLQLFRRLTLNAVVEAPDTQQLVQRLAELRQAAAADGPATPGPAAAAASLASDGAAAAATAAAATAPELEPCTAHAALRCALPGHDLTATAGYNLRYMDSGGDVAHVPLAVSLDLSSHDRQDGLQYRVGLHQVTAPLTELPARPGHTQRWRTSLHAQGALAVEGEAHIWRGGRDRDKGEKEQVGGSASSGGQPPGEASGKVQGRGGDEAGGGDELRRSKLATALDRAKAEDEEPLGAMVPPRKQGKRGKKAEGEAAAGADKAGMAAGEAGASADGSAEPPQAAEMAAQPSQPAGADVTEPQIAGAAAGGSAAGSSAESAPKASWPQPPSLDAFMRPLEQMGERVGEMLHRHTHPHDSGQPSAQQQRSDDSGYASGSSSEGEDAAQRRGQQEARAAAGGAEPGSDVAAAGSWPSGGLFGGLSSQAITATIQDSVALLHHVKDSVEALTSNVQDGSLQRLSQQLADSRQAPPRRRPYSLLLAQPHLKINAALGCLARMPLPALRAFSFPQASLEPLDFSPPGASARSAAAPAASTAAPARRGPTASLLSRASPSSALAEAWQPYLKGTALRVFASAGLSGQLGRFTRPFLDYTAASARVDVGLTSPHVVGVVPDPASMAADAAHRPDKHRGFALEGRGAWHALSLSVAQQVLGPLRARVDARFALDPTSVPASQGERSTVRGVLQTALSMRPSLLETVYGCDLVLPGTEGAARLAIWYSPKRRECMAELRLF